MSAFAPVPFRLAVMVSVSVAFGVLAGCARTAIVPLQSAAVGTTAYARTPDEPAGDPPTIVVRDYWGAPAATVVAWSPDDDTQGLRTEVRRDGSVVHDHQVYLSTHVLANYKAYYGAEWHAFTNSSGANSDSDNRNNNGNNKANGRNKELINDRNNDLAQPLQTYGLSRDIWNCKGAPTCSPYETFSARVPDKLLRSAKDNLVIKVRARNGGEEVVCLGHDLIKAYLKTVDSLSSSRRFATAMAQRR